MTTIAAICLLLVAVAIAYNGRFSDDDGNTHEANIELIAIEAITLGCDSSGTVYCPADNVTRGQMAAFIVRALGLVNTNTGNVFTDDDGSTFENDIEALQAAGITLGCNAAGTLYCPSDLVTRGQMAAFISRAFGYTDSGTGNYFTDDNGSTFETDIDRLRTAGITLGCNAAGTLYCPNDPVRRDQMASFLARALNLGAIVPPPPPPPPPSNGTTAPTQATTTSTTAPDSPFTWAVDNVESGGNLGYDTDMVAVGDGRAAISTREDLSNSPAYVLCENESCTETESVQTLVGTGVAGISSSLQIVDGRPIIASYAPAAADLRVDRCTDLQCTGFSSEFPLTEDQGDKSSMVTINGLPVIASFSAVDKTIEVVACEDVACSTFSVTVVAENIGSDTQTSMAVVAGLPAIAYWHFGRQDVEYILCLTVDCSDWSAHHIDGAGQNLGKGIDLAVIGQFGLPAMSYQNATDGTLLIARCSDFECTSVTVNVVDGVTDVGEFTSIASGPDGYAWIGYYDSANTALKFADCENATCSVVDVLTVDGTAAGANVGGHLVLINLDDHPLIAYLDSTNNLLKTAYGN